MDENLSLGIRQFHDGQYKSSIEILLPYGKEGNKEACLYLGRMGIISKQYDIGKKWLEKIEGYPEADFHLAMIYYEGLGLKIDKLRALNYLKASASYNYSAAQKAAGILIEELHKEYPDDFHLDEAANYYLSASKNGDLDAMYAFSRLCFSNVVIKDIVNNPFQPYSQNDYMPFLKKAAKQGHEPSQSLLEQVTRSEMLFSLHKQNKDKLENIFKKLKILEFKDLSKLTTKNNLIKYFKKTVGKEINLNELLNECFLPDGIDEPFFYPCLEEIFDLSEYNDHWWTQELFEANPVCDISTILTTSFETDVFNEGETLDSYQIINFIETNFQFLLRTPRLKKKAANNFEVIASSKKFTRKSLELYFQKEQRRFSRKTNTIFVIGDLFGDKSKGINSDYDGYFISEFKYLNKFASKLSKRKKEEFVLGVGDLNGKYLPMSKNDVMKTIKKYGKSISLRDVQEVFRGDIEIVEYFVGKWGWDLKFASQELQNDSKLILLSRKNIKKNKTNAIKQIVNEGFHANRLFYACSNDKNIVSRVIRNAGHWYHQISPNLKEDFEIALAACKNYGGALSLIESKKLLKNKQIISAALLNDPEQIMNVSSKNLDHKLVLKILKKEPTLLEFAPKKFLKDKSLFVELCKINPAVALTPNINWRYLLDIKVIKIISNAIYYPSYTINEKKR